MGLAQSGSTAHGGWSCRPCGSNRASDPNDNTLFLRDYDIGEMLGSGTFSQVRACWPIKEGTASSDDEGPLAVKIIDMASEVFEDAQGYIGAREEAEILQLIRHTNIVEIKGVYEEEDRWIFVVLERLAGGELFRSIADPKLNVFVSDVITVGRQLLQALGYLHFLEIAHRDVKPENILLESDPRRSGNWHIKLIDFGLATKLDQRSWNQCKKGFGSALICGTAYYCAPEVWAGQYGPKTDIWAAGVLIYLAIYGAYPFFSSNIADLEAAICSSSTAPPFLAKGMSQKQPPAARVSLEDFERSLSTVMNVFQTDVPVSISTYRLSQACCDCIGQLLSKDSETRPGAVSALTHRWFQPSVTTEEGSQRVPAEVRARAGWLAERPAVNPNLDHERTAQLEFLMSQSRRSVSQCGSRPEHILQDLGDNLHSGRVFVLGASPTALTGSAPKVSDAKNRSFGVLGGQNLSSRV